MKKIIAFVLALAMLMGIVSAIPHTPGMPEYPSTPTNTPACGSGSRTLQELGPLGMLLNGLGCMSTPSCYSGKNVIVPLVQKNSTTWEIIHNGAKGTAQGKFGKFWEVDATKLKPNTMYTFIYYGDKTNNDVWPYATCIKAGKSDRKGKLSLYGNFDYSKMKNDGKDQKFWIILSSDVDCAAGKMIAWNPDSYLFETRFL